MPLDCLVVPCGFEESLVDFDSSSSSYDSADVEWSVSELDSETLSALERENMNKKQSSDPSDASSWCRNRGQSRRVTCPASSSRRSQLMLWTPRHRLRDERKRILKLSLAKLQIIDDPESCLRRSVLLSNTLRGLQRQIREEKSLLRQQSDDAYSRLQHQAAKTPQKRVADENPSSARSSCSSGNTQQPPAACQTPSGETASEPPRSRVKRRRTSDASDTETEVDALQKGSDDSSSAKSRPALRPCNSLPASPPASPSFTSVSCLSSGFSGLVSSASSSPLSLYDVEKQYSCGQSSLFGELQSVVFQSLITSLES